MSSSPPWLRLLGDVMRDTFAGNRITARAVLRRLVAGRRRSLLLFAVLVLVVLVATWPDPAWRLLIRSGVALMVITPITFHPFSKSLWLAVDLLVRPASAADFDAHHDEGDDRDPAS